MYIPVDLIALPEHVSFGKASRIHFAGWAKGSHTTSDSTAQTTITATSAGIPDVPPPNCARNSLIVGAGFALFPAAFAGAEPAVGGTEWASLATSACECGATAVPQFEQNAIPGRTEVPQAEQTWAMPPTSIVSHVNCRRWA